MSKGPRLVFWCLRHMPLAAINDLSDAESAPPVTAGETKKKAKAKSKSPEETKKISVAKEPKEKTPALKKPAAALKRPAAVCRNDPDWSGLPNKANKYWYTKEGKIGIKVDGREVMTVLASTLRAQVCARLHPSV